MKSEYWPEVTKGEFNLARRKKNLNVVDCVTPIKVLKGTCTLRKKICLIN